MVNRKGFLAATLWLTIWMVPVSADETADDIVTMMGWWQEHGRYWDEVGADTAGLEENFSFAENKSDGSSSEWHANDSYFSWLEALVEEFVVVAERSKQ